VVLLDFDGTLATRPGLWTGCVLELLNELDPGHAADPEDVRLGLCDGFPWDHAAEPHLELCDPDAWWNPVELLIERSLTRAGATLQTADRVARATRKRFADPSRGWQLFPDAIPALSRLRNAGWQLTILSNHIPELPALSNGLGLADYIQTVVSSAAIGYEKPHPEAFMAAVRASGYPRQLWMVGDSPVADIDGAQAAGIPAILVRRRADPTHNAQDLTSAANVILAA
jgi:putative hydrolase of the HAD superfamily